MKLTGVIAFRDIEMGVWVLNTDDGKVFQLSGGDRPLRKAGLRVEADGEVVADAMSTAMVGPLFRVRSYRAL